MTGEHLAIIILIVAWLLTAAWWRLDTARWHAKMDNLEDRLQSQVPQVLERQADYQERMLRGDIIPPQQVETPKVRSWGPRERRAVAGEPATLDDAEGLESYNDVMVR